MFLNAKKAFSYEKKPIFEKKSPPFGGDLGFWVFVFKKSWLFSRLFAILARPKSGLFLS